MIRCTLVLVALVAGCRSSSVDCGSELVFNPTRGTCTCPDERPTYWCPSADECHCIEALPADGGASDGGEPDGAPAPDAGGDAGLDGGCTMDLGTIRACLACGDVCGWDCEAAGCNDAAAIAAGGDHACALRTAGDVVCWGRNSSGQLGIGMTSISAPLPISVPSIIDAVSVAAGTRHTCAVARSGSTHCWGVNGAGQLGDGSMVDSARPVLVGAASSMRAVASTAPCASGLTMLASIGSRSAGAQATPVTTASASAEQWRRIPEA